MNNGGSGKFIKPDAYSNDALHMNENKEVTPPEPTLVNMFIMLFEGPPLPQESQYRDTRVRLELSMYFPTISKIVMQR